MDMVNPKELLRQARSSEDHEAYVIVARGAAARVGVGARTEPHAATGLFVEIILDPFPERPVVATDRLVQQARLLDRLKARGYAAACEQDGTIACERRTPAARLPEELRAVRRLLGMRPDADRDE